MPTDNPYKQFQHPLKNSVFLHVIFLLNGEVGSQHRFIISVSPCMGSHYPYSRSKKDEDVKHVLLSVYNLICKHAFDFLYTLYTCISSDKHHVPVFKIDHVVSDI